MPLDPEEKILLNLTGTVALPAPPPGGASIEIVPPPDHGLSPEETYLRLTRHVSLSVVVRWTVQLRHVSALAAPRESFPPDSPLEPWPVGDGWAMKTSEEVQRLVRKKIAGVKLAVGRSLPWIEEGVVFVPESTPVLRQAESGMTAAESVQYFPAPSSRLADLVDSGSGAGGNPC